MRGKCCQTCHGCSCGRFASKHIALLATNDTTNEVSSDEQDSVSIGEFIASLPPTVPAADITTQAKCSQQELAIVLAMAMQESDSMQKTDTSKDSHGGAKNVSPFNLNLSELGYLGCDKSCANSLGSHSSNYNVPKSVFYVLKGIRGGTQIGSTEDFMNFHRGGSTGWKQCKGKVGCECSYGCKAFRNAIADMAKELLRDPRNMADGKRLCRNVKHVH